MSHTSPGPRCPGCGHIAACETEPLERFLSVKHLARSQPSFSEASIRWHLFNRERNGLGQYVSKVGSRLYISEKGWNAWLAEQAERKG